MNLASKKLLFVLNETIDFLSRDLALLIDENHEEIVAKAHIHAFLKLLTTDNKTVREKIENDSLPVSLALIAELDKNEQDVTA